MVDTLRPIARLVPGIALTGSNAGCVSSRIDSARCSPRRIRSRRRNGHTRLGVAVVDQILHDLGLRGQNREYVYREVIVCVAHMHDRIGRLVVRSPLILVQLVSHQIVYHILKILLGPTRVGRLYGKGCLLFVQLVEDHIGNGIGPIDDIAGLDEIIVLQRIGFVTYDGSRVVGVHEAHNGIIQAEVHVSQVGVPRILRGIVPGCINLIPLPIHLHSSPNMPVTRYATGRNAYTLQEHHVCAMVRLACANTAGECPLGATKTKRAIILHVVDHPIVKPQGLIEVSVVTGSEALGRHAIGNGLGRRMGGVIDSHPHVDRLIRHRRHALVKHRETQPVKARSEEGDLEFWRILIYELRGVHHPFNVLAIRLITIEGVEPILALRRCARRLHGEDRWRLAHRIIPPNGKANRRRWRRFHVVESGRGHTRLRKIRARQGILRLGRAPLSIGEGHQGRQPKNQYDRHCALQRTFEHIHHQPPLCRKRVLRILMIRLLFTQRQSTENHPRPASPTFP